MNIFEEVLKKQKAIIIDGALGTQIQRNGHNVNDSLWSAKFLAENPQVIKDVHMQYLQAGADIIITSSYQASFEGFLQKGFSKEKAVELLKLSINIALETRDEFWENCKQENRIKPLVAASVGPYGAYLADGSEYSGDYKISDYELKNFHKKRLEVLIQTNPDIYSFETIPSLNEAKILCELIEEFELVNSWLTFSAKNESFTNANDEICEAVKYLDSCKLLGAIGINCTAPQYIPQLIENVKSNTNKPIVIYPNGGSKYNPITKNWEKGEISPVEYAKMAHLWFTKGATIIGGCCETGPEEIKEIRNILLKF